MSDTLCLDGDLCRHADTCSRAKHDNNNLEARYQHFWNGNNDIGCRHYIIPWTRHYIENYEGGYDGF